MLQFQAQQFPFRYGLDEGTDPNQQAPGRLTTLENGEWVKGGRIQKRDGVSSDYGTTYYSGSSSGGITAGKRLLTRGSELCLIDGSYLYSFVAERAGWQRIDQVPDVGMTWTTGLDTNEGVSSSDVAYRSPYLVQAWRTGAPQDATRNLWVRVIDRATGALILAPTLLSTAASLGCRVLVSGATAFVVWREAADINVRAINLTTMTVQAADTLRTDARATSGYDAKVVGSNIVLAYEDTANALKLYSYSYDTGTNVYTQTASGGVTGEAANDFRKIAIDGISGERIYVAYCASSPAADLIRVATVSDSTLAQVTAPVTQETAAAAGGIDHLSVLRVDTSGAVMAWAYGESVTAGAIGRVTTCKVSTTCVQATGSLRGTWGTRMISRLFAQSSRVFIFASDMPAASFTEYVGGNSYLLEVLTTEDTSSAHIPHRYAGKLDMLITGGSDYGFLPSAVVVSSTESFVPVPFLSSTPQTINNWRCGLRHVRVLTGTSLPADMWRSTEYGGESYLSGSLVSAYDGRVVFDYGIARGSVVGAQQNSAPTAGAIGAGTYLYGFVEEWRSSAGILHRSSTSSTSVASGADGTTTLYILTSSLSNKRGGVPYSSSADFSPQQIATFRSVAGGAVYYRWTYEPNYNTTTKSFQASSQTITDTRADANIGDGTTALNTRPIMYTAGGIVDDDQPPNLVTHALHKSRLWGVSGDQRTIWFSKSFQDDLGVAPGFSPSFRLSLEEDITAIWSMDEKGVIASAKRLWYFVGGDGGPAATGQGSDIQGPFPIQTDVGCTNPRSVVSTPDGTMFESDGRVYLLTRGLEIVWIGRQVQDKLASFPSITSAVLVPEKNQVRFTCNNSGGTAHTVLVYDYVEKQWSTFRYVGGTVAIADALVYDGEYHFLTTAGTVYRETSEVSSLDADAWVTMTLETAWISAGGPLAFQSVRRFALHGVSHSNHGLTVSVAVDRSASYSPAVTWASGSEVTAVGPLEAAELHLGKKCSSIRFKIVDASPGGALSDGRGPSFDTMGIEVGIKKGFQKKPAAKRG